MLFAPLRTRMILQRHGLVQNSVRLQGVILSGIQQTLMLLCVPQMNLRQHVLPEREVLALLQHARARRTAGVWIFQVPEDQPLIAHAVMT